MCFQVTGFTNMIALPENMIGERAFWGDYHLLYIKKDHLQGYYFNIKPCGGVLFPIPTPIQVAVRSLNMHSP